MLVVALIAGNTVVKIVFAVVVVASDVMAVEVLASIEKAVEVVVALIVGSGLGFNRQK